MAPVQETSPRGSAVLDTYSASSSAVRGGSEEILTMRLWNAASRSLCGIHD